MKRMPGNMADIFTAQEAVNYAMLKETCKVYETSEFKFRGAYGFNVEIHAEENTKMTVYITEDYIDRAVTVESKDGELMFAYYCDMDYWDSEDITLGDDKEDITKDTELMEFYKSRVPYKGGVKIG